MSRVRPYYEIGDQFKVMVVDNFFGNFNIIKDEFKKIPRFTAEKHPELDGISKVEQYWPGERSEDLKFSNKFLTSLFLNEFSTKFARFFPERYDFKIYTHLRLEKDNVKDFVHRDSPDAHYSMLVYLSETNLNSGTNLYEPFFPGAEQTDGPGTAPHTEENMTNQIKFVQNRALMFDSFLPHRSIGCYGDNEDNGRLTLNIFWHKGKN